MAAKKTSKKKIASANKKRLPVKITKSRSKSASSDTSISHSMSDMHPKNFMADEVWNFVLASLTTFVAIFFVASYMQHGGPVGEYVVRIFVHFLGLGYWLVPALMLILAYSFIKDLDREFHITKIIGSILFTISGLAMIDLLTDQGGLLGSLASSVQNLIGMGMTFLLMAILFVISLFLILNFVPFISRKPDTDSDEESSRTRTGDLSRAEMQRIKGQAVDEKQAPLVAGDGSAPAADKPQKKPTPIVPKEEDKMAQSINQKIKETFTPTVGNTVDRPDNSPPLSLLSKDSGKPQTSDTTACAMTIKRTFANFGIDVEMVGAETGPTVTRYAFKPAEGVKLARIASLKDDLALALAAKTLRMETPIPGKSLVGIEVPNTVATTVGFGSLLADPQYVNTDQRLPLAIGKDIAGNTTCIDLADAPHMLIAGTTGAGKSVTVHAIIMSMLYKHGPDMLKFIMIDPKRVEMTLYNGIPHLLTPVITDAKAAILALKWAVKEMNRRYDVLQEQSVRDIHSYHGNITAKHDKGASAENGTEAPETMPYIVIIIDELADIMQAYPRELEAGIVQLAQMSRAVGIHLVLSTQRPSVNVITGLIKANVPTRLSLKVSSAIDSRTILDMGGAEQLLGRGDMLYITNKSSTPSRVQCALVSESEVKSVVSWLKKQYRGEVPHEIDLSTKSVMDSNVMFAGSIDDDEQEDDLYNDAKTAVVEAGKASTSYLQRRLRVGYSRAARLMDMLEDQGVIGAADGSKPREILGNAPQTDTEGDTEHASTDMLVDDTKE